MAIYFPDSHITHPCAEGWRTTSAFQGNANPILNWEKQDDVYGSGEGGPILTYSNGVFTFAKYGYYLVTWHHYGYLQNASSRYVEMYLYVSWNNGSNYDVHGLSTAGIAHIGGSHNHGGGCCSSIVTGTSAARMKFRIQSENSNVNTGGSTNEQTTCFTISKVIGLT